jgi:4-diphosphocytidyl-2-C-methyl-D-erythritol kinase
MLLREVVTKVSSASSELTVLAPAKVNLILRILDRRADGYHNLWSLMQTVALEDEVRLRLRPGQDGIQLQCDASELAADRTNLVHRAAFAVLEQVEQSIGIEIDLRKRIPMGAGLGGGSSDAAATIIGLNRLLQLNWTVTQMAEVGQSLGSDVPFFLYGPTAIVSGRGVTVRPLTIEGTRWVVLVNPGFGVETKWAYNELASTRVGVRPLARLHQDIDQRQRLTWRELCAAAENDFESPVFAAHGMLREIKQTLLDQGADLALLSGSGATVFGLFANETGARRAKAHFSRDNRLKVSAVSTCSGPLVCH